MTWNRRSLRPLLGPILGVLLSATVMAGLGLLLADTVHAACTNGVADVPCEQTPLGPSGEPVSDHFYFSHRTLTGDGTLTVRLTSMTGRIKQPPPPGTVGPGPDPVPGVVPWAKAGIMIKDGVRQGSSYAAIMMTAEHGVRLQYNFTHDVAGPAVRVSPDAPRWLRLVRTGEVVGGETSADGQQWTSVGSARIVLPRTAQIGLFAASPGDLQQEGATVASRFSEVTAVFDRIIPAGSWTQDDVGVTLEPDGRTPHHPGGLHVSGDTVAITGVGDVGPATSDAGLPPDLLLIGTFAGAGGILAVAVLLAARTRRAVARGRGAAMVTTAAVVAVSAVVAGSAAAALTLEAGSRVLVAHGAPLRAMPTQTEVRIVLGTGLLLALVAVLGTGLGGSLRRLPAMIVGVTLVCLPELLGATVPVLPVELSRWLLRITPAAGFAIQQSSPTYPQVLTSTAPVDGYYPLSPWTGLAVTAAFAVTALAAAALVTARAGRAVHDVGDMPAGGP